MDKPERNSRAVRTVALVAAALVVLVVASVVYLRSPAGSAHVAAPTAPSAGPTVNLGPMYWLSENSGWAVLLSHPKGGEQATLIHTTDGGRHWQRQLSFAGFPLLRFFDGTQGVMAIRSFAPAGGPMRLYRTNDGGAHWLQLPPLLDQNGIESLFVDSRHGWFVSAAEGPSGGAYLALYRSTDDGEHWVELLRVDAQHPVSGGISQTSFTGPLTFTDALHGYLGTALPDGSRALYVTRDGGWQWQQTALPAPTGGWLLDATRPIGQVAVDPDGRGTLQVTEFPPLPGTQLPRAWVFVTTDGGANWSDPVQVPPAELAYFLLPAFADGRNGWIATKSAIWTTGDSGRTWQRRSGLPGGWTCHALTPASARVSWCEGVPPGRSLPDGQWQLFRTTDGGRHWQQMPKPSIV